MSEEQTFYCVWREGGGVPTVKHNSFANAALEAQRLARLNPGARFVVLGAVRAFIKSDLTETRFVPAGQLQPENDDEIPW